MPVRRGRSKKTTEQESEQQRGEVVEAEVVEEVAPQGEPVKRDAVAVRPPATPMEWTPRLVVPVAEMVQQRHDLELFMQQVLKEGTDYGAMPGSDPKDKTKKKVLFKSGAEQICSAMRLHPVFIDAPGYPIHDLTGDDHIDGEGKPEPFIGYRHICEIRVQTGPGLNEYMVIATGIGSSNSMEVKYRYRTVWESATCPECGEKALRQSKGGAMYCWAKIGGCGVNFARNDPRVRGRKSVSRQVKNTELMDLDNTLDKMSQKRALVAATLIATGFSSHFTQDLEDKVHGDEDLGYGGGYGDAVEEVQPEEAAKPKAAPKAAPKAEPEAAAHAEPAAAKPDHVTVTYRETAKMLGATLEPPWPPKDVKASEAWTEAFDKVEKSWPHLIGLMIQLHDYAHGPNCSHVRAIPAIAEYQWPHDEGYAYGVLLSRNLVVAHEEGEPKPAAPPSEPKAAAATPA